MPDPADYYREIYLRGLGGEKPSIPVAIAELERRAAEEMEESAAAYVFAGAGTEETMDANRAAFARRRLVPRMLRDVAERDLSTTVLGTEMPAPLLLAPVGVQKIVHEDGELATARAAGGARRADDRQHHLALHPRGDRRGRAATAPRWFQLYWPNDRRTRRELRQPGRGRRLRRDRRHRRHLHPRLEAARPPAGLASVPAGDGRRQLLPGPGLPRGPREAARRRTSAPRPAISSASTSTPR